MRKLLTRTTIERDDFVFVFSPSPWSSSFFSSYLKQTLAIESYSGNYKNFPFSSAPRLIFGGDPNIYTRIICPHFDQNPLLLLMLQDPVDHVIESYLRRANPSSHQHVRKHEKLGPKISFGEFLSDPANLKFFNNPQWFSLLTLFSGNQKGLIRKLSTQGQKHLIFEKIEQAAFIGLVDFPNISIDLFNFIFTNKKFSLESGDFGKQVPVMDHQTKLELLAEISPHLDSHLSLDYLLFDFVKGRLFNQYRQMIARLISQASLRDRMKKHLKKHIREIGIKF